MKRLAIKSSLPISVYTWMYRKKLLSICRNVCRGLDRNLLSKSVQYSCMSAENKRNAKRNLNINRLIIYLYLNTPGMFFRSNQFPLAAFARYVFLKLFFVTFTLFSMEESGLFLKLAAGHFPVYRSYISYLSLLSFTTYLQFLIRTSCYLPFFFIVSLLFLYHYYCFWPRRRKSIIHFLFVAILQLGYIFISSSCNVSLLSFSFPIHLVSTILEEHYFYLY